MNSLLKLPNKIKYICHTNLNYINSNWISFCILTIFLYTSCKIFYPIYQWFFCCLYQCPMLVGRICCKVLYHPLSVIFQTSSAIACMVQTSVCTSNWLYCCKSLMSLHGASTEPSNRLLGFHLQLDRSVNCFCSCLCFQCTSCKLGSFFKLVQLGWMAQSQRS